MRLPTPDLPFDSISPPLLKQNKRLRSCPPLALLGCSDMVEPERLANTGNGVAYSILCMIGSLFNHSCAPNAAYMTGLCQQPNKTGNNSMKGFLRVFVTRSVACGEEICIGYSNLVFNDKAARARRMAESGMMTLRSCYCLWCTDEQASAAQCVTNAMGELAMWCIPPQCLHCGEEVSSRGESRWVCSQACRAVLQAASDSQCSTYCSELSPNSEAELRNHLPPMTRRRVRLWKAHSSFDTG